MEDGGEDPGGDANAGEPDVEGSEAIVGGDLGADLAEAGHVRPEIGEGEEHAEGLLHAQEAVEWPFAVELDDVLAGLDAAICDYVLTGVVAFAGAVPEEEAMEKGYRTEGILSVYLRVASVLLLLQRQREGGEGSRIGVCAFPGLQFSALQIYGGS